MLNIPKVKVLVLGASGLLGQTLVPYLRTEGFNVIAHGNQKISDVQCDAVETSSLQKLIFSENPDFVINLIALTDVDRCNSEIDLAYRINVKVVENIVSAISTLPGRQPRLIHISTDHVYDGKNGASSEGEVVLQNVYALSKYAGDMTAQRCDSVVLRTNFIGPGRVNTRKSFTDRIQETLKSGTEFFGFSDSYFNPLTSVQLCREVARVMIGWCPGIYNVGASSGLSKYDFVRGIALRCGLDASLIKARSIASISSQVVRPKNMLMDVKLYESAYDTKLPDLECVLEEVRRSQI